MFQKKRLKHTKKIKLGLGNKSSKLPLIRNGWWYFYTHFKKERKKTMKAMLSQPMAGKTDEEIVKTREKAMKALEAKGYEVVNTLFTDEWYSNEAMKERGVVQIPLCFLAKSLENMSLCHAAYFCKGWENARGCKLEHDAAVAYGLDIIYEE
nr:MAG TPA: deoxyribosyltransferase [Caudoviricetes sp.]